MSATTVKFEDRITNAREALEAADLFYNVKEAPLQNTITGDISKLKKQLYRSDNNKELGVVGIGYHPVQNITAFSYFDSICQIQGAYYSEAISINNGSKIILKAEFPNSEIIGINDEVKKQFCLVNGFDGSIGVMANFMVERLICSNGLKAIVRDAKNSFKFKHTENVEIRMEDALKVLAAGTKYFDEFIKMSNELVQKQVDSEMVDKFLDECFGTSESTRAENKRNEILGYFENGIGNNGNNLFELYNSVTEYVSHHHCKSDEKRIEYANFGGGVKLSEKAFKTAYDLI